MRKFTSEEKKARKTLITTAHCMTNVARSLQPKWEAALGKYGVDMRNQPFSFSPTTLEVVNTEDFSFLLLKEKIDASKALLMVGSSDFIADIDNTFYGKQDIYNKWSEENKKVDTILSFISNDGFTLELNAKILLDVIDSEKDKFEQDGFLFIPIIIVSGMFIKLLAIYFEKHQFEEINRLQSASANSDNSDVRDSGEYALGYVSDYEYLRPLTNCDLMG